MRYSAKSSSFNFGNHKSNFLDIIDYDGNEIASIQLTKNENIHEETFIHKVMEIIDGAYTAIGKTSPFSKLHQADDEQRMMAIKDIQRLLSIFDKAFTKGCVVNADANDLLEIAKKWNEKNGSMIFTIKKPEPLFI